MKKQILIGAGALVLVAVPAVIGLWGNASFAQSVPVRVPSSGQVVTPVPTPPAVSPSPSPSSDDDGGDVPRDQRTEPGDDRDVNGTGSTGTAPGDTVAPVDDNGGDVPRDQRTEPGDDRRSGGSDDGSGSGGGSDDSGSGGGHGGDD